MSFSNKSYDKTLGNFFRSHNLDFKSTATDPNNELFFIARFSSADDMRLAEEALINNDYAIKPLPANIRQRENTLYVRKAKIVRRKKKDQPGNNEAPGGQTSSSGHENTTATESNGETLLVFFDIEPSKLGNIAKYLANEGIKLTVEGYSD